MINMQIELDFQPIVELKFDSIPERFKRFHIDNPHVYNALVSLARKFRERKPNSVIGIGMLYEVLRWNYYMATESEDDYKLSNDYRACYARKIMDNEPDLKGIFNIKQSVADK
tara:strand:- start:409 stop:747 length:339 start_codon:yes stop_codon:yes gene_type:complete